MKNVLSMIAGLVAAQQRFDTNLLRLTTIAAADETVTIGDTVLTGKASGTVAKTFVVGADANASATALAAAINATKSEHGFKATKITDVGVFLESEIPGARSVACSTTMAGENNAWAADATFGGSTKGLLEPLRKFDMVQFSPTAVSVALGTIKRKFGFAPGAIMVYVRDTNGKPKAWDGKATVSGNVVSLDNSGDVDIAATDKITIWAMEA